LLGGLRKIRTNQVATCNQTCSWYAEYAESLKGQIQLPYREEYRLEIDQEREPVIVNDRAVMPRYDLAFLDIICFVIAKSVALERIEERVDVVFDEVEVLIANLGRGKLELPDRKT
jgi:uncharacterized Rmd1/YagE family protein